MGKGYQVHPEAFAVLAGMTDALLAVQEIIKNKTRSNSPTTILVEDVRNFIDPPNPNASIPIEQSLRIIRDSTEATNTGEGVEGYSLLFRSRFEKLMRIISQRPESRRITKIAGAKNLHAGSRSFSGENDARSGNSVMIAGLVMSRRAKKNGIEIEVDDYTGIMKVLAISEETRKQVLSLAIDQAVMLEIEQGRAFAGPIIKAVIPPDIPDHVRGKSKSDSYAVLISDLHVGSKHFMLTEFLRFIEWLSSPENEIASKIKFLCVGGDIIDGIGIFPNQDKELTELDAGRQMQAATELLSKVPKHIKMLIIPGNHDPGRRALPQPAIPTTVSDRLWGLENCVMLGNPAFVELNGVKVLMYHGQSLDDVIATTPGMSYSKPAQAMKVLLKARHLAPTFGSRTPIAPEVEDMMVISEVPDILHSGHVHVTEVDNYRGTLVVNSGAWQSQTKFQQTMAITPTPGIAIAVNLATLQPTLLDFNESSA